MTIYFDKSDDMNSDMTPIYGDQIDGQLIALLHANAREPVANLARKLGLARTTVIARIAKLERNGTIAGYGLRIGKQLESASVRAYCELRVLPKSAPAVINALSAMPEVKEVSAVSGQFDYLAFLSCQTHEKLDQLLDRLGAIEGVHQTQTAIILNRKIDRRSIE
jgi:DNA-binding Lrp family transcriptional regulator